MGFFDDIFGDDKPVPTATPNLKTPVNKSQPVSTLAPAIKPVLAAPKVDTNENYVSAAEDIAFYELKGLEGWHEKGKLIGTETTATVGWGSKLKPNKEGKYTVPVQIGEVLTREEADKLARGRIRDEFIPALKKIDPYWDKKNPNEQAAMLSYMHHTGPGIGSQKTKDGTRLLKQQYIDAIKSPNWKTEIPKAMLALKMSNEKMQNGINARQKKLVQLFNKPYSLAESAELIDQDLIDMPEIR